MKVLLRDSKIATTDSSKAWSEDRLELTVVPVVMTTGLNVMNNRLECIEPALLCQHRIKEWKILRVFELCENLAHWPACTLQQVAACRTCRSGNEGERHQYLLQLV